MMRRFPQRGQALTEFVIIALVLIPLFLLVPLIAKYQDIVHATQMASRYLAFDGMAHNAGLSAPRSPDQLAIEVRRRFFSNSEAPIKSGDAAGDFVAHQNVFWRDPQGGHLIRESARDITIGFGRDNLSAQADGYSSIGDGKPYNIATNTARTLGLNAPGVFTAKVNVALADIGSAEGSYTRSYDTFRTIGLSITRHTSLLVDPWMAEDEDITIKRIDKTALFPGALLKKYRLPEVTDFGVALVESPKYFGKLCTSGCGPKLGQLEFWKNVVPQDRLK
jgi:hypothetical protein